MLYKFKSKVTGDLIMLEPNGRRVLQIIGKDPGPQGIILPAQMAGAAQALEGGVWQFGRRGDWHDLGGAIAGISIELSHT